MAKVTTWSDALAEGHGKHEMMALFIRKYVHASPLNLGATFVLKAFFKITRHGL